MGKLKQLYDGRDLTERMREQMRRAREQQRDIGYRQQTPGYSEYASGAISDLFPTPLDAVAAMQIPGISDAAGVVADAGRMYRDPEYRTWGNAGMMAAGALPFVPSGMMHRAGEGVGKVVDAAKKKLTHGQPGYTRQMVAEERRAAMTPQMRKAWRNVLDKYPNIAREKDYFTPDEIEKLVSSPEQAKIANATLAELPRGEDLAPMIKMGESKRGWYEASSKALVDVFGPEDSRMFARLLAATSPRQSVQENLKMSLGIWEKWNAEGRPKSKQRINELIRENGGMGGYEKNVHEALLEPPHMPLSGPKVNSFAWNLQNDVMKVTEDAWQANSLGINQDAFSGKGGKTKGRPMDPGLSGGYMAANARMRRGADILGWDPREAQESYWSISKHLFERPGSAEEAIRNGAVMHEQLRGVPDFSTLLRDPQFTSVAPSLAPKINALQPYDWPPLSGSVTEGMPPKDIERAITKGGIRQLDREARVRGAEARATAFAQPTRPGLGPLSESMTPASLQAEAVPYRAQTPGAESGLPEKLDVRFSNSILDPFEDIYGHNRLMKSLGLDADSAAVQRRALKVGGVYDGPQGTEFNPARSYGITAPLTPEGGLDPKTAQAMRAAGDIQASMTFQDAVPTAAPVLDLAGGKDVYIARKGVGADLGAKKFQPTLADLVDRNKQAGADYAWIDQGHGTLVHGYGDDVLPGVTGDLGTPVPVTNKGWYGGIDNGGYGAAWNQPGQNLISEHVLGLYRGLTAPQRKGLDKALQHIAPQLREVYLKKNVTRPDFLRYLELMGSGGLPAIEQAIKSGEKLIQRQSPNTFGGYA
jgi:hypothetical protein